MVDGVNRCAVIPWIRHANHGGTLFDVAVQSRCSDELMQWSPTNGLREVLVHVDVVVLEVVVHVDEDVVVLEVVVHEDVVVLEASRRVRVRSPKTLSAA
jgi:hypothetical protein